LRSISTCSESVPPHALTAYGSTCSTMNSARREPTSQRLARSTPVLRFRSRHRVSSEWLVSSALLSFAGRFVVQVDKGERRSTGPRRGWEEGRGSRPFVDGWGEDETRSGEPLDFRFLFA
jgi:hypothetical protein